MCHLRFQEVSLVFYFHELICVSWGLLAPGFLELAVEGLEIALG